MSLRDQLQKAGLASKKDAKKAANAVRSERRKTLQDERQGIAKEDEVAQKIKEEIEERKERDKQLNQQIEQQRREQEKVYQAREIVLTHDVKDRYANLVYRFAIDGFHIRAIMVTHLQLRKLAEGEMGIASPDRNIDGEFYLLTAANCRKVEALHPGLVLCLHEQLPEGETLDYSFVDEEYYLALFDEELQKRARHSSSTNASRHQRFGQDDQRKIRF